MDECFGNCSKNKRKEVEKLNIVFHYGFKFPSKMLENIDVGIVK